MDHYREFFKQRVDDINFKRHNFIKTNRAKQRADNYLRARDLSSASPESLEKMAAGGVTNVLASSTPMVHKKHYLKENNENANNYNEKVVKQLSKDEEKRLIREAYKKKFMTWRAERRQQQKEKKQKQKPFLPCGKATSTLGANRNKDQEPPNVNNIKLENKRASIYIPLETPKKKNKENQKPVEIKKKIQWIGSGTVNKASSYVREENIYHLINGKTMAATNKSTHSLTTATLHKQIEDAKRPLNGVLNINGLKCSTGAIKKQQADDKKGSFNGVINTNATKTPANIIKKQSIDTKQPLNEGFPSNGIKFSEGITKKEAVVTKEAIAKSECEKKQHISKAMPCNKTTSTKLTSGAIGKAKMLQSKKNILGSSSTAQRKEPTAAKLATNFKPKKPTKTDNLALAVAATNRKTFVTKCNIKIPPKITKPLPTPTETGNAEQFGLFTTSTQVKPTNALTKSFNEFADLCKTLSPVEAVHKSSCNMENGRIETNIRNMAVKRALLQDQKNAQQKKATSTSSSAMKNQKFNFLIKYELETTVMDSPGLKNKNKFTQEQEIKEKSDVNKSALVLNTNQNETTKTNGTINKKQMKNSSNVLNKMKKMISADNKNVQNTSSLARKAQRKSLQKFTEGTRTTIENNKETLEECIVANDKGRKSSKFNFIRNIELETTVAPDVNVDESTPQKSDKINSCKQETPKTPELSNERPINYLSPFVTVSRGKVSARKEKEKRNSIYLQETPVNSRKSIQKEPAEVSVVETTPIEIRRSREAIRYFRQQLANEIQRLHELCDKWEEYKTENIDLIRENNGDDMVNVTIGQTKLLTSKKFMQFKSLIDRCEAHINGTAPANDGSEDTKEITPVDLEGFWSMLGLQVDNIEKRFENLDRWKANNWQDPDAITTTTHSSHINTNLNKVRKTKKATGAGVTKAKPNEALRKMMLKIKSEMQAKKKEELANNIVEEEAFTIETVAKETTSFFTENISSKAHVFSPRRTRRSILCKRASFSNSPVPGRINIVVPDRKSMSIAPTIISVPSPRNSPLQLTSTLREFQRSAKKLKNHCENNDLLKTAVLGARRSSSRHRSLNQISNNKNNTSLFSPKNLNHLSSPPRTPSLYPLPNACKSILKTPGTSKRHTLSVVFNEHTSVKKFRTLHFDDENAEDIIEQGKIKSAAEILPPIVFDLGEEESASERVYRLRNRKVKLRPSCEIEIP